LRKHSRPFVTRSCPRSRASRSQTALREIAEIRHSSLYAPRDFDISAYFMVVKATLARGFNHKDIRWADLLQVHTAEVTLAPAIEDANRGGRLRPNFPDEALSCWALTPFQI
jgi:hypothetical protein